MTTQALESIVQGQTEARDLIWQQDGAALDLSGYTITGRIQDAATGVARAITGTLSVVTAADGRFRWTFSTADTGTAGSFWVQFTAVKSGKNNICYSARLSIEAAV